MRIIWVNWPYSNGERRYPIIPPIGPFIFCLRSRKKVPREQTKSLRATIFSCGLIIETAQDLTHVHFISCSCPSACLLISVTEHLISHTGQTKKGWEAFPFYRKSSKTCQQHLTWWRKGQPTATASWIMQIQTQACRGNVLRLPHLYLKFKFYLNLIIRRCNIV